MKFEVDERLTPDRATEIMQTCRFTEFERLPMGFDAFHAESGLNVFFDLDEEPGPARAEGLAPPAWNRHCCITFRYNNASFDACESETMKFARALASGSPAFFVLSFQYEHVYAVHDAKGFREIANPSSTMKSPTE